MNIKKFLIGILGFFGIVAFLSIAKVNASTTINTTVRPTTPVYDANNVVGVDGDSAPGFLTGSVASDGTGKTDIYLTPEALFERDVTLGEIAKISYWTKKGSTHVADPADWYLTIYTKPYDGDISSASWYGDRIGSEPYFSINLTDPADTWNNWTTDGSVNKLRFFESTAGAPGASFGSYTDPDWNTFISGNALSGNPYSGHEVLFFSVQTGSAWADGFTGQVDGLTIELNDGSKANVNFEPNIVRSAEITAPLDGSTKSGNVDFTANLTDDEADSIQWAVREGTCAAGTSTVFGNVDGHTDVASIDQSNLSNQTFSFTGNMSAMTPGTYCFIYNPVEDNGETDIRLTSQFTLEAQVTPTPNPYAIPAECSGITDLGAPIVGTNGSNVINGTNGNDLIFALGGSDVVNGKGGDDCIVGGDGSDSLHGQGGNDVILGGSGSDAIQGDGGNDWLYGQDGSDSVKGGSGDDHLFGGNGSDSLKGDGGADNADGGNNSDACNAETETTCEA